MHDLDHILDLIEAEIEQDRLALLNLPWYGIFRRRHHRLRITVWESVTDITSGGGSSLHK